MNYDDLQNYRFSMLWRNCYLQKVYYRFYDFMNVVNKENQYEKYTITLHP